MLNYQIYNQSKNQEAPIYLFLGGYTATSEVWYPLAEIIKEKLDCTIILVDNLGGGKSQQPHGEYTTLQMAELVIEVIEHLKIQKLNLIGHSMGGSIAQQITLLIPQIINQLYLLSTSSKYDKVNQLFLINRYELAKSTVDRELIAKSIIPTVFGKSFLNNDKNIEFAISRVVNNPQTLDGLSGQMYACLTHDTTNMIQQIKCKTLIIVGSEDILVPYVHSKYLHEHIHGSVLQIIDDCAHMVQLEKPQKLAEIILANTLTFI